MPESFVLHRSPGAMGIARVSVPVETISPALSFELLGSSMTRPTRWRSAESGPSRTFAADSRADKRLREMRSTGVISPIGTVISPLRPSSVNDEQLRASPSGGAMRRTTEVRHLIAHTRLQLERATIPQFGVEFALKHVEDVAPVTPMIREVARRVFHSDIANVLGSPEGASGLT